MTIYYHEHRKSIPGFKDYELTDQGNLYIKGTTTTMIPLIIDGVRTYQNKYGKYLLVSKNKKGEWYFSTTQERTEIMTKPEKLSLNISKMLCATITLKFIEHKKYFPNNSRGIKEAQVWAEHLEKQYYP